MPDESMKGSGAEATGAKISPRKTEPKRSLIKAASARASAEMPREESRPEQDSFLVRKPKATEFFRTNGENLVADVLSDPRNERDKYLVCGNDWEIPSGIRPFLKRVQLERAINNLGTEFVLFYSLYPSNWLEAMRRAVGRSRSEWIRTLYDADSQGYRIQLGPDVLQKTAPEWSGKSFEDILERGFSGRIVDSPDHKVIRMLEGEGGL